MSWHHGAFMQSRLDLRPTRDGTERMGGEPVPDLRASARPAAAFCDVPGCDWSAVWPDEAGAAGLVMAHVIRKHGKDIPR